jgi:hypothetical protein
MRAKWGLAKLAEVHQFAEWMFVEGPLLAQSGPLATVAVATKLRCPLLCKVKMSLGSF